jgi:hypothetical protein
LLLLLLLPPLTNKITNYAADIPVQLIIPAKTCGRLSIAAFEPGDQYSQNVV